MRVAAFGSISFAMFTRLYPVDQYNLLFVKSIVHYLSDGRYLRPEFQSNRGCVLDMHIGELYDEEHVTS